MSAAGTVAGIETLRTTEPLTSILQADVARWRFEPSMLGGERVSTRVLVAAVYRPPVLYNLPGPGEPPKDVGSVAADAPYPIVNPPPGYPANALGDGVALVEVLVGTAGEVKAATVIQSTGAGFNPSAIQTATQWRFRPARRDGVPVPSFAYLVFGFRQPITTRR